MKRTLIVALACFALPDAALAQSVSLAGNSRPTAYAPMARPRLSAEARARIDAAIAAAAARGTPVAPLRSLAAEGEARLASESRITAAIGRLEETLQESKRAFTNQGRKPSEVEVAAGAEVLSQGATPTQLESVIRRAAPGRSLEVALTTLSTMVARGEPVAGAVAEVEAQLAVGGSDAAIAALAEGK
jgi:hypothetical protein